MHVVVTTQLVVLCEQWKGCEGYVFLEWLQGGAQCTSATTHLVVLREQWKGCEVYVFPKWLQGGAQCTSVTTHLVVLREQWNGCQGYVLPEWLQGGALVHAVTKNGYNSLHFASANKHSRAKQILLEAAPSLLHNKPNFLMTG